MIERVIVSWKLLMEVKSMFLNSLAGISECEFTIQSSIRSVFFKYLNKMTQVDDSVQNKKRENDRSIF